MQDVVNSKDSLRKKFRKIRSAISLEERNDASGKICVLLKEFFSIKMPAAMAVYRPVHNEANIDCFIAKVLLLPYSERTVLLAPRINRRDELEFAPFKHLTNDFSISDLGIPEPVAESSHSPGYSYVAGISISCFLTPGIAFDPVNMHRLGYGRGYYDRVFVKYPDALRVGIAFEEQLCTGIPYSEFDTPMHVLITEKRIIRPEI